MSMSDYIRPTLSSVPPGTARRLGEQIADEGLVYFAPDRRLDRLRARADLS